MSLKAVITAAEHGAIDPAIKALYKQEGESFILDLEGTDNHPSVRNLRNALDGERTSRATKERELNELRSQLGDLKPEDARAAAARVRELEQQLNEGDVPAKFKEPFEKAVETRVASMRTDFENKEKGYVKIKTDLEQTNQQLTKQLEELMIDGAVRDAAVKAGIREQHVEDAIMHARQIYRVINGKVTPIKPGTKDEILYGKNANEPKPIIEWLGDKIVEKPGWVKQSSGGGAGNGKGSGGGEGANQFQLTKEQARDTGLYRRTKAAAEKAGQTVTVVE